MHTHIKKRYAQSIHNPHKACTHLKAQTSYACIKNSLSQKHTDTKPVSMFIVCLRFFLLLFPLLFGTEFVMSLKIGPFHLLSLKCHYLGGRGRGSRCHWIHFFHSNRVINIFSAGELVTRLFGVRGRSHASLHLHWLRESDSATFMHSFCTCIAFYCIHRQTNWGPVNSNLISECILFSRGSGVLPEHCAFTVR